MKIIEFDIPKWIIPKTPYWIEEYNLLLFASKNKLPNYGYYRPEYYTRFILYDYDEETVKKTLRDFIVFSEFLYRDNLMHRWFGRFPLSKTFLSDYEKEIEDLEKYIKSETVEYDQYLHVHDFEEHPLYEISSKQNKISFKEYFKIYSELTKNDKARQLIDFFTANSISQSTLNSVYDNSNMFINNYFILIEALIKIEIPDLSGTRICPDCGKETTVKKKMTDLIKIFAENQTIYSREDREILVDILIAHYKLRNSFSHEAKYNNAWDKFSETIKKLDKKGMTLHEEIKHADGMMMGVNAIDSFVRIKLLTMLEECGKN